MSPASKAPSTWSQYFGNWSHVGSHPLGSLLFLSTSATAKTADTPEVSNNVTIYDIHRHPYY
ncbi:hypothetical protein GIB67_037986 [Kingdonia uniflora]|uniref:Uncharacterized protein n=1 Tax=Kingdonia uniflora TaxID=39325 RepID=A0A7J7LHI6_9MAGN|nr:hypothetical protein GIB67_037986 [Kingdonia uniflora]